MPTGPSCSISRPVPVTPPTRLHANGSIATVAISIWAGTPWRDRIHARQIELGVIPAETALSERPIWVRPWDALSESEQALAARFMECFAGFLSYTDAEIGRLAEFLDNIGELDDTVIIVVSDNGASAEGGSRRLDQRHPIVAIWILPDLTRCIERLSEIGGPLTHNNYPWGWTMAGNTPFRRWKREVHEGGVADPCIVQWPNANRRVWRNPSPIRARRRRVRDRASIVGIEPPDDDRRCAAVEHRRGQLRLPSRRRRRFRRGTARDTALRDVRFTGALPPRLEGGHVPSGRSSLWRRSRTRIRASRTTCGSCTTWPRTFPRQTMWLWSTRRSWREMIELWWQEARAQPGLPLDNRVLWALVNPKPDHRRPERDVPVLPGRRSGARASAVERANRSHALIVDITVPEEITPEGTLLAIGSGLGGWSLQFSSAGLERHSQSVREGAPRHRLTRRHRRWSPHPRVRVHQGRRAGWIRDLAL